MNKQTFLTELRTRISGLPEENIEERLTFYSEMIDDFTEDGLLEDEAVAAIGTVDSIAAQINAEIAPAPKAARPSQAPRKRRIWLLVLTYPFWFTAFCMVYSGIILLWSLWLALWSVFVAFAASAVTGAVASIMFLLRGYALSALFVLGGGLLCAGLSILLFFLSVKATKGMVDLTKKMAKAPVTLFKKIGGLS